MSITGPREGPPSRVGVPIIDITSGMFASSAILAALLEREGTGLGQHVDVSLLDTQTALLANVASSYLLSDEPPQRQGNAHPSIAPYEPFQARDKGFVLGAANQGQWVSLCQLIDRTDLVEDPRFKDNQARVEHREELNQILGQVFRTRKAQEWLTLLEEAGLPCGPINSIPEVFQNPQVLARDLIQEVEHPLVGRISLTGFPYKLSRTPAELRLAPPALGEHNREILVDLLGYSEDQFEGFQEKGVI